MENQPSKLSFQKAFDEMPFRFTSMQFVKSLMNTGGFIKKPYTYEYQKFLIQNCIRERSKTWRKLIFAPTSTSNIATASLYEHPDLLFGKNSQSGSVSTANTESYTATSPAPNKPEISDDEKLKQAIAFCKSKGLRVTRITEEEL